MIITKQQVAIQVLNYLQHKINLNDLVTWAEEGLMEGNIQEDDHLLVRDILGKLGLADVKAFGLYWDDCEEIMKKLGYVLNINAGLVA
jgi:hypothetical protein